MSNVGTKLPMPGSVESKLKLRVLLVEDNVVDAELVLRAIRIDGFDIDSVVVQDEPAFTRALRTHRPEVVLADYNLPNWKGMEALDVLRREASTFLRSWSPVRLGT